jgi:serine/threonine-protein kinase
LDPPISSPPPGANAAASISTAPGETANRQFPDQFGRFRIIRPLGHGSMGSVYLAEDTELGRKVALKIAHVAAADNPEILERFKREARAAALLDHPYLCPVHEVGVTDGIHYIVMAYIEGQSLAELIDGKVGFPPRQVAALISKLAVALHEAHQRGVYHRDLKPSNIMIKPRRGQGAGDRRFRPGPPRRRGR